MAFPQTPLPIKGEILINGVWTDVTSYIRNESDISITRGFSNEQYSLSASQCSFTLNNRDGRFSDKNPLSPYYGLLGRNTQFRVGVTEATTFLGAPGYRDGVSEVSTADKAVLDIVGDIDIRADVDNTSWLVANRTGHTLAGKYRRTASNNRSWLFSVDHRGRLVYTWSTDGTNFFTATSTTGVPVTSMTGRLAFRVTHDVDNGAAGNTVTFYTSDTIAGTWTALGSAVVTAGVTSIFSGNANLEVGNYDDGLASAGISGISVFPLPGRIYAFELRSGIAGTLVAKMDATAQAVGATSWSDGLGTPNTWTVGGSAFITNVDYRFWGQLPALPNRWDTSGRDIYIPTVASGYLQQLMQGQKSLDSAMYRYVTRKLTSVEGYWPFEDGTDATQAASGIASGRAAIVSAVTFGTDSSLPSSDGVVTISDATSYVKGTFANLGTGGSNENFFILFKYPAALGAEVVLATILTTGTVKRWEIRVTPTNFRLVAKDVDGVSLIDSSTPYGAGIDPATWLGMQLKVTVSGGTVTGTLSWYNVSVASSQFYADAASGSFAGTLGRFSSWSITNTGGGQTGLKVAHAIATRQTAPLVAGSDLFHAATAWVQEYAGQRWSRLCAEEGVPYIVIGAIGDYFNANAGDSQQMGPQTVTTLVTLLQECADADRAMMFERRNFFGLALRLRRALHNQNAVSLSYANGVFSGSLDPTPDDSALRNDVTVSRSSGSSARAARTVGPLNTSRPEGDPQGVGPYAVPFTRNVYRDIQLPWLAQYEVQLGTIDELRYPQVQVNLARTVFVNDAVLSAAVKRLDIGNPFAITGLPAWLPPDTSEQLILGYTERLQNRGWVFTWNATPYSPFRVSDMTQNSLSRYRMSSGELSASYTSLATDITNSATSFTVTGTGRLWGTTAGKPGNFPLLIKIGGELMSVGAISGTSYPQTFSSVTRSVNGVVKAHLTGAKVQIAEVSYMTLGVS